MKPTLKATTKTYIEVDYYDLDNFINACFPGAEYECVALEEWSYGTKHSLYVDGVMDNYATSAYATLKATRETKQWCLNDYLNGMCADGLIPAGVYLINVSW